ncbi:MAG: hypothetical protein LC808_25360 [Actinobacteria bacterium]|nr:hypothetical protein [Actinomycetota bacterium]
MADRGLRKFHGHRFAEPLHLSRKMVRNYVSSIFTRLGLTHRATPCADQGGRHEGVSAATVGPG